LEPGIVIDVGVETQSETQASPVTSVAVRLIEAFVARSKIATEPQALVPRWWVAVFLFP
jgi:hypothetical protein